MTAEAQTTKPNPRRKLAFRLVSKDTWAPVLVRVLCVVNRQGIDRDGEEMGSSIEGPCQACVPAQSGQSLSSKIPGLAPLPVDGYRSASNGLMVMPLSRLRNDSG